MAKAVKKVEKVERVVVEEVASGVVLTLDNDEAQFLRDVMGLIGGNPYHSRRRHADSIYQVLSSLGFCTPVGGARDLDGNIIAK